MVGFSGRSLGLDPDAVREYVAEFTNDAALNSCHLKLLNMIINS